MWKYMPIIPVTEQVEVEGLLSEAHPGKSETLSEKLKAKGPGFGARSKALTSAGP
jgi:hypothetical protein